MPPGRGLSCGLTSSASATFLQRLPPAPACSRGAHLAERFRPFANYHFPVQLLFFLSSYCAGSSKRTHLAILSDRNGCASSLFASGIPGYLVDVVQEDLSVFPLVFLHCAPHSHDTGTVARVLNHNH